MCNVKTCPKDLFAIYYPREIRDVSLFSNTMGDELQRSSVLTVLFLSILIFSTLLLPKNLFAHDNKYVHPYIAEQGLLLLPTDLRTAIYPYLGSFRGERSCADAHSGSKITEGASDEDVYNPKADDCSYNPLTYYNYHFYDPDDGSGLNGSEGSPTQARWYFNKAKELYPTNQGEAFWYVGRAAHLLADASVPAHAHLDPHGLAEIPGLDSYEDYMELHYNEWNFTRSQSLAATSDAWSLEDIFFQLAQRTQYFPSDDENGNDTNLDADTSSWPQNTSDWRKYSFFYKEWYIEEADVSRIGDYLMPLAFQYTAALYKRFWHETHLGTNPAIAQDNLSVNPGVFITQSGSGFTGAATATLHFRKPDGSEYPTKKVALSVSGEFTEGYYVPLSKEPGDYTWWAVDDFTGNESNAITYTVGVTSFGPHIDQRPGAAPRGATLEQWGYGFTPHHDVTLHFLKPDGTESSTDTVHTNAGGYFEVSYTIPSNKPYGTYTWWAVDDETGVSSNTYSYEVTTGHFLVYGHTVYETETWYSGGTYVVQGSVTVAQGATLTIEPGVVVKFANQQSITVDGTLDARGTDDKKIVFTSVWDDTYGGNTDPSGGDHTAPGETWQLCPECTGDGRCAWAANYWGTITFGPTSVNSVIDRAFILYGGSVRSGTWCYNPYATGMVSIQSSAVAVTNSTVSHSWGNGIDVSNASPVITGDSISGNGGRGIYLSGNVSSLVITDDTISGNGDWGIGCYGGSTPSITGNIVSNNGAGGISCSPSALSGNIITGNNGLAIQQDASGAWADGSNTISGNTYDWVAITGGSMTKDTTANSEVYLINSTVTIPEGVKLTIEPGVVVKFANQQSITVDGTLDARGTDDKKIVFTSVWDDTYGGNTDPSGGDHTAPGETWQLCPECTGDGRCAWAANYWGTITFGPTSVNSVIDRAFILYGGSVRSGTWCYNPYATGMVSIQSSAVAVTNSTVSHSSGNGIDVSIASPMITGDTISGNGGYGLSFFASIPLTATNNNWGSPSGPLDDSDDRATGGLFNPNGLGNKVSDHVNYYPWTGMTIGEMTKPTGLSGTPGDSKIYLKWNLNTEPYLGGYKIYKGISPGSYKTPVIVGNVTSYTLTGINNGTRYYVVISSINSVGAESAKSDEISVIPAVDNTKPTSTITQPTINSIITSISYTIHGTADDGTGSGVQKVEVSTDGGTTWNPATGLSSWSYEWTIPAEGTYTIKSRATDAAGNVEIPKPGITVTAYTRQPSTVTTNGSQLLVNSNVFTIQGVGYSPTPIGIDPETTSPYGDYFTSDYHAIYDRDLPLLRDLGANTIRLWSWNTTANHLDFLDKAYNGGVNPIFVIAGYRLNAGRDIDPNSPLNERAQIIQEFVEMVSQHKNHPAILMWAIGNELNAPWMYGNSLNNLFSLINEMAEAAHAEEESTYHPVTTPLADMDLINTINTYNASVPSLDIWGANVYRGNTFGTLFNDYKTASTKPFVILEYGIDAYDNTKGNEYEKVGMPRQAEYAKGLWQEISGNSDTCIGGSLKAYSDEWWKGKHSTDTGCPDTDPAYHGICGYQAAGVHPDDYSNEEWWGIMRTVDNDSFADIMEQRIAYYVLQAIWKNCAGTFYMDYDGDGYGNPGISISACAQPPGYVADNTDCNDVNSAIHPGVSEICDNIDNNCDGNIDEGLSQATTCGVGVCAGNTGAETCSAGVWGNNTCNPFAGATNEVCDGLDNDCDGQTDEGLTATYYQDADKDGYGDQNTSTQACAQPAGYVSNKTDCDDTDANEHPGQTWYKDADKDKYSDGTKNTASCTRPANYFVASELTALTGDCNDGDAFINPGAAEVCNGKDDNCNLQIDEGVCFILSCPDSGIQCVERICDDNMNNIDCEKEENRDDNDNLVDGNPKVDVKYEFRVNARDIGGTPEYVKLFMTQRNNPNLNDFYSYTMTCSGDYSTGATCTYLTKLGPAAVHKFYFEAKSSDGETVKYPESDYITGPVVQLLTGYNLTGIPRNINSANLNGSQAFGSSTTYRWDASAGYYKLVTNANPVKTGEGYFSLRKNNTLYELINYGDIQANEYTYQLNAIWNIISNPYAGNVKLLDIKVQKGSETPVTWEQAITNNWIVNAIYYYKGSDWGSTYDYETSPEATLVPWMGYWVKLNKEDDTYYLVIPKP